MNVSAYVVRNGLIRDSDTICLRCLRRLTRSARSPQLRKITNSTPTKAAALSIDRPSRNGFKRDYFSNNGILQEVVGLTKKGLRDDAVTSSQATAQTVQQRGSSQTSEVIHQEPAQDIREELPHRRRKRLKQEAEAAKAYPIAPDASAQLSSKASSLPTSSARRLFATYLSLTKPRLTFLILLTTTSAYGMFPVPALLAPTATATPSLSTLTLLFLTTGTGLASASANTLNMLFEPQHDAKMTRTRNRPIVRNLVSKRNALLFAIATGLTGVTALYYGVNPTVAFLGGLNIFVYAGLYTPLKRMHVINTWAGAVVGGIPPLMGWAAAAGQTASHGGTWDELLFGENSAGGWLLAALLFAWQFPHFNSLSWTIREEYKNAGYRMLAFVNPKMNARVALRYSILMFPICIGLSAVGVTDPSFVWTSSAINGWMVWESVKFWRYRGQKGSARALFWASVWHLPIVLVLAMVQKNGLGERISSSVKHLFGIVTEDEEDEYEDDYPVQARIPQAPFRSNS